MAVKQAASSRVGARGERIRGGMARTEGGAEAADEGEGERHQHVLLHSAALALALGARV